MRIDTKNKSYIKFFKKHLQRSIVLGGILITFLFGSSNLYAQNNVMRVIKINQANAKKGKTLFLQCSGCHGLNGEGKIGLGPRLNSDTFLAAATDDFLRKTIAEGRSMTSMIPWKMAMKPNQIDAVIAYLRTINNIPPVTLDEKALKGDFQKGSKLFNTICYGCHGVKGGGYSETSNGTGIGRKGFLDSVSNGFLRYIIKHGKSQTAMRAFYGPKIDFDVLDALGRDFQCATIQLDFQLPRRFELSYIGADNDAHIPVVIHRAIFGSFERFIGILIEHYAGAFPVWLAPEQVRVITVSEKSNLHGGRVRDALTNAGVKVSVDMGDDKIGRKIRECHGQRLPYMAIVGEREQEENTVSIRSRDHGDLGSIPLDEFVARVVEESKLPMAKEQ